MSGVLLNILQCIYDSPPTKSCLPENVSSAEVENPCPGPGLAVLVLVSLRLISLCDEYASQKHLSQDGLCVYL